MYSHIMYHGIFRFVTTLQALVTTVTVLLALVTTVFTTRIVKMVTSLLATDNKTVT